MIRRMKYLLPLIVIGSLLVLPSCKNNDQASQADVTGSESSSEIIISKQQFESGGMKVGDPAPHIFSQTIKANGYVSPSPSGWAKVSSPISGRVKQIWYSLGDKVRKGQSLFSIEGNEIIMIQQEYAESFHQLKSIQKTYDRQKELSEERVTSEKDFLKAESEYHVMLAKVDGLKAQLEMINIDPRKVENGHISGSASIVAPISGFVTDQELVLGQSIDPEDAVIELIDTDLLQLNIHVFERDLANMQPGQELIFYDPDHSTEVFQAVMSKIGKSLDADTKTVQCIAKITSTGQSFVGGLYVETEIQTCQRESLAIPGEAIVEEDGIYYVLLLSSENDEELNFQKMPVKVGVIQGNFVEVLDEGLKNILLEGGYNILSQE